MLSSMEKKSYWPEDITSKKNYLVVRLESVLDRSIRLIHTQQENSILKRLN